MTRALSRLPAQARGGFTLVEVLVAAFVLVTALGSSLLLLSRGFEMVDTARNAVLAGQIMQSEIEKIRLRNWAAISAMVEHNGGTFEIFAAQDSTWSEVAARFDPLEGHASYVPGFDTSLVRIELTASWLARGNRVHTRKYETLFAKDGINDYYIRSF